MTDTLRNYPSKRWYRYMSNFIGSRVVYNKWQLNSEHRTETRYDICTGCARWREMGQCGECDKRKYFLNGEVLGG